MIIDIPFQTSQGLDAKCFYPLNAFSGSWLGMFDVVSGDLNSGPHICRQSRF